MSAEPKIKLPRSLKGLPFSFSSRAEAFLYGMKNYQEEVNEDTIKRVDEFNKTLNSTYANFRKEHDRIYPNLHIIDKDTITETIIQVLKEYFFKVISKQLDTSKRVMARTTNKHKPYEERDVSITGQEWLDMGIKWSGLAEKGITKLKSEDLVDVKNYALYYKYLKVITSEKFVSEMRLEIPIALKEVEDSLVVPEISPFLLIENALEQFRGKVDLTNTNQIVQIGKEVGVALSTLKKDIKINPMDIGLPNNYLVIYTSSFSRATDVLQGFNNKAAGIAKKYLAKEFGKIEFHLGNLLNLGHAAVIGQGDFLVANTPGLSNSMRQAYQMQNKITAQKGKELTREVASQYKTRAKVIDNSIKITKRFSNTYLGVFMSIGGTVTIPEYAIPNQARGRTDEKAAADLVKELFASKKAVLDNESSRNITQYILDGIGQLILGKKVKGEKVDKQKTVKTKSVVVEKSKSSIPSFNSKAQGVQKKKVPKARLSVPAPVQLASPTTTNLSTLMTLINANLAQTIRKNMGSPALNYRSGRFANSAKVERVSESRAGMVTMFYNYMKNPYQTFEPGFKQGSEKRNPKTLISKSIREIAAQQVGNRLRAVRV